MRCHDLIRESLKLADTVAMAYLSDLSEPQLSSRPHSGCNTVRWQIGHLILSEHQHMQRISPDGMPELPAFFSELFAKASDANAINFATSGAEERQPTKEQLLDNFRAQRNGTLELLALQTDQELELPTGVPYAATRAALFHMQGAHWLMHCGQWVIVRRQNSLPVVI